MNIDIKCCDNLELMATIKDKTVDLIYCDILYGTGRKFDDYQDLKPERDVIKKHYVKRVREMHRVLKDTGSIYLQMDTRINHWMRCIMDDIFGYDNFRTELVWLYNSQGKTNKEWNKKHDHILYYTKSKKWTFNAKDVVDSISDLTYKRFKKEIDTYGYYTVLKNGKRTKYFLKDGSLPKDWHDDITYISRDNKELTGYNTQKPKALIERLIKASSNEGDLVADFYAGSFTTAEVCNDLNRSFIGCDINPKAVEIGRERITNGFEKDEARGQINLWDNAQTPAMKNKQPLCLRDVSVPKGTVCQYCQKPSERIYDDEIKAWICNHCKAYWQNER